MGSSMYETPKRHILGRKHVCALGVSRRIKQKTKKKVYLRNHNMCFYTCSPRPPTLSQRHMDLHHTRDPIIYSKFHRNPFRGFGAPGGHNLAFPITLASRFYNSLYYRTSRDCTCILLYWYRCSHQGLHEEHTPWQCHSDLPGKPLHTTEQCCYASTCCATPPRVSSYVCSINEQITECT